MTRKKTSYNLDINLLNKLKAIASLKNIQQVDLVEKYLSEGIEKDKEILKKLID
jgi:hypothetical protein